jgi:hypothetical protein
MTHLSPRPRLEARVRSLLQQVLQGETAVKRNGSVRVYRDADDHTKIRFKVGKNAQPSNPLPLESSVTYMMRLTTHGELNQFEILTERVQDELEQTAQAVGKRVRMTDTVKKANDQKANEQTETKAPRQTSAEALKKQAEQTKSRRAPKGETLEPGEITRAKNRKVGVPVSVFKLGEVDEKNQPFPFDREQGTWATVNRESGHIEYTTNRRAAHEVARSEKMAGPGGKKAGNAKPKADTAKADTTKKAGASTKK